VAELRPVAGSVSVVEPDKYKPGPGIALWDYRPDAPFRAGLGGARSRHLFLVEKKDLPDFHQKHGANSAAVVLKPVSRATLVAFLSFALRLEEDGGPASSAPGGAGDDILQCLIHTNFRLQERDQGRLNVLLRALHDLRAPLTALCGYCDFLMAEGLGPLNDEQKSALGHMLRSTRRLSRVAAGIHQLSTEGQARSWLDLRKGHLRECVERAVGEVAPLAKEKRLEFAIDLAACAAPMCFESEQIDHVLINLLDNACRFSPRGVNIEVRGYPFFWERRRLPGMTCHKNRRQRVTLEPNSYRIDVSDSGAPLAPDQLRHLFDEHSSDGGYSSRSGIGLSLAICRAIVKQHMGSIWAENTLTGLKLSLVLPFYSEECPAHPAEERVFTEGS
jgi:signal transduction histidine kinase